MRLPEHICLRSIQATDWPLLRSIFCSTRESELAEIDWSQERKNEFLSSQFDLQRRYYQTHFPKAEFYVVQYLEEDVGRLYLDQRLSELRLIDIALLTAWRNRGIGSSILRCLLDEADHDGKEIVLHVEVNNPALSLYNRLGFERLANNGVYLKLRRQPHALAA